jgi:hypothetical protein
MTIPMAFNMPLSIHQAIEGFQLHAESTARAMTTKPSSSLLFSLAISINNCQPGRYRRLMVFAPRHFSSSNLYCESAGEYGYLRKGIQIRSFCQMAGSESHGGNGVDHCRSCYERVLLEPQSACARDRQDAASSLWSCALRCFRNYKVGRANLLGLSVTLVPRDR